MIFSLGLIPMSTSHYIVQRRECFESALCTNSWGPSKWVGPYLVCVKPAAQPIGLNPLRTCAKCPLISSPQSKAMSLCLAT